MPMLGSCHRKKRERLFSMLSHKRLFPQQVWSTSKPAYLSLSLSPPLPLSLSLSLCVSLSRFLVLGLELWRNHVALCVGSCLGPSISSTPLISLTCKLQSDQPCASYLLGRLHVRVESAVTRWLCHLCSAAPQACTAAGQHRSRSSCQAHRGPQGQDCHHRPSQAC
jgi:hypothetical protein